MIQKIEDIIDLKSHELIDQKVANRQKEVILKGFNYLSQQGNDFLYIGDEVGLGKTYIAMGIMSLLRHVSPNLDNYKDFIIVPKSNLQDKWQKEINNFIKTNYKIEDSRVKSIIGTPVAVNDKNTLFESLEIHNHDFPAYYIYRMSSFSVGVNNENWNGWINSLKNTLQENSIALHYFEKGKELGYFRKTQDYWKIQRLKRFYAYLLNIIMPIADCLIVDEAHNFRKGNTDREMSARNAVTSCLFGINNEFLTEDIYTEESNEELRMQFFDLIKSKVKKVIFLSATPIKTSLSDIKNQINCFKANNIPDDNIEDYLSNFMIRGIMNFEINNKEYSRNQYRHEHRNGNVKELELCEPLRITKDIDAITFGLFQYKLIKELQNLRYGRSFEIGMLTGFETFSHDTKRVLEKEYEEENNSKSKQSVDVEIIKTLIDSYQVILKTDNLPPHPKQNNLINELYDLMINQKKALVFVRRVASTYELEQRLMKKYEEEFIYEGILKKLPNKFKSDELNYLIKRFVDKKNEDKLNSVYTIIFDRIKNDLSNEIIELLENNQAGYYELLPDYEDSYTFKIKLWFDFLYNTYPDFANNIKDLIGFIRIADEKKLYAVAMLNGSVNEWQEELDKRKEQIDDELKNELKEQKEDEKFFFNRYFSKNEGLSFKNRVRIQDWFEFNYFLINEKFKLFKYNEVKLEVLQFDKLKKDNQKIDEYTDIFKDSIIKGEYKKKDGISVVYMNNTFLTRLLFEKCEIEFQKWLDKIKSKNSSPEFIFTEFDILEAIIKNIFRNGSGLLPAFVADKANTREKSKDEFTKILFELITEEKYFGFVLDEIKEILNNYTLLRNTNFPDADNLDQQVNKIHSLFRHLSPVIGTTGQDKLNKRRVAAQFRLPGFPYVLITTDVLKEGEDLHTFCKNIYHYGIPWSPIDMEQRTGRIDRIGSYATRLMRADHEKKDYIDFNRKLQVFFPYLTDTVEVSQVVKVFNSMNKFIDTFYDFTKIPDSDTTAKFDENIIKIPQQKKVKLASKYEHDKFIVDSKKSKSNANSPIVNKHNVISKMNLLAKEILKDGYEFYTEPYFDDENFTISGNIKLASSNYKLFNINSLDIMGIGDERRAPFKIMLAYDSIESKYILKIYSKICKCAPKEAKKIINYCFEKLSITEYNDNILVRYQADLDEDFTSINEKLKEAIYKADILEFHFMGELDDEIRF